jgi:hypothetical protein
MMHGLVPGREMLTKNLSVTYAMVWSIAIANLVGSGLCFLFSGLFARAATLRYTLILPVVLSLIYIGAFEGTRNWGDLYALFLFGIMGWVMKHLKWPRPPLVLGFILGQMLERYMFISIGRYGTSWLFSPIVLVLFSFAALSLCAPLLQNIRQRGGLAAMLKSFHRPAWSASQVFPLILIVTIASLVYETADWTIDAKIVPLIVAYGAILFCALSLANSVFGSAPASAATAPGLAKAASSHFDIASGLGDMPAAKIIRRGMIFFGWLAAFMLSMAAIGLIPTVPVFIIALMRVEGHERWRVVVPMAVIMTIFIWLLFDRMLAIPWPGSYLGDVFGWWKQYVPSA